MTPTLTYGFAAKGASLHARLWTEAGRPRFVRRRIYDVRLAMTLLQQGVEEFATANVPGSVAARLAAGGCGSATIPHVLPLFLASLILGGGFVIHALHGRGLRAGSLRSLGAFLAVFGAAGATFIAGGAGRTVALQVAIAAGVAGTLVPGAASWRARASRTPEEPPLELEGCEGEVVAPLAGASIGRIRVDLGGRWMEFGAVCERAEATPAGPGSRVRVVAVRDGLARVAPVEERPEGLS